MRMVTFCRGNDIYSQFPAMKDSQQASVNSIIDTFLVRDTVMKKKALSYGFSENNVHICYAGKPIKKYSFSYTPSTNISILT